MQSCSRSALLCNACIQRRNRRTPSRRIYGHKQDVQKSIYHSYLLVRYRWHRSMINILSESTELCESGTLREFPVCKSFLRISPAKERHFRLLWTVENILTITTLHNTCRVQIHLLISDTQFAATIWSNPLICLRLYGFMGSFSASYRCCGTAIDSGFFLAGAEGFSGGGEKMNSDIIINL